MKGFGYSFVISYSCCFTDLHSVDKNRWQGVFCFTSTLKMVSEYTIAAFKNLSNIRKNICSKCEHLEGIGSLWCSALSRPPLMYEVLLPNTLKIQSRQFLCYTHTYIISLKYN